LKSIGGWFMLESTPGNLYFNQVTKTHPSALEY